MILPVVSQQVMIPVRVSGRGFLRYGTQKNLEMAVSDEPWVYPSVVGYNDRRLTNGGFFMLCMSELREYGEYLRDREMSENTVEKYLRDAENFLRFSNGRGISRELMMEYKSCVALRSSAFLSSFPLCRNDALNKYNKKGAPPMKFMVFRGDL